MTDEQRESLTHLIRACSEQYFLLDEPKVFTPGLYMRRFAEHIVRQIADHDYFQDRVRVNVVSQEVIDNVKRQIGELREQEERDFAASGQGRRSLGRLAIHTQLKRGCK